MVVIWQGGFSHLKSELSLEDPVEGLAVPTRIRLVEAVVGAHDVGRTSLDQVDKRPVPKY